MKPNIIKEKLTTEFVSKYMNVYEYPFGEGGHYYTASRRKVDDLVMFKSSDEYKNMLPDAVTILTILVNANGDAKMLFNYEFRYATSEYILAPPAGLIDKEDMEAVDPIVSTAVRELKEETGIIIKPNDRIFIVNPLVFSSPGMTDESNAIVCAVINNPDVEMLNHNNIVGSENFDGFELVDIEQAGQLIKAGRDKNGNFYSVYTLISLMYFVSQLWR